MKEQIIEIINKRLVDLYLHGLRYGYETNTPLINEIADEIEAAIAERMPTEDEIDEAELIKQIKDAEKLLSRKGIPDMENTGADEILEKHLDSFRPLKYGVIYNKTIDAMNEFAALHAQRIADKMVSERCKKCKYRGLPDSINEALNSGDGVYRP